MSISHVPLRRPRSRRAVAVSAAVAVLVPLSVGVPLALSASASPATTATSKASGASAATLARCPWMDTRKTPEQRANLLLKASTLDQKLRWLDEQAANSPTQTTFSGVTYPVQVDCTPQVVYTDGPDYVRGSAGVTIFPDQIGLAASWDQALAYDKGAAQADEAFRSGKNVILGPGVSSGRTPLAGRTPEYLGEDSLLSGDLAAADINGIQNGNPDEPVMAVVKHYIANEQELDRQTSSSNIDGRTLREIYNLPFQILLSKSQPGGIMCSYNQVNGAYACENPILNNLLKGDTGFDGFVVSDFGAVHSTAPSLANGLDQELNRPKFYTPATIGAALDAGQVTVAQIDEAALRVVKAYIAAGLFDHPLPTTPSTTTSTAEHKALAEQIATQGSVLLKNKGDVLPLTKKTKTIAIVGPTASNTPTNGVSAATVCNQGGSFGGGNACTNPVAPLDAITARAAQVGATVTYANGSDPAAAAAVAAKADVAIVFGYSKQGEGSDRTTLSLDNGGDALISAVAAANKKTVVILETGSATDMPWLASAKAVVEAWYPGEQQGTALAKLLYGDENFTGRLPMTFPKSLADTPTSAPAQYPGVFADGTTTRPSGSSAIRQVSYSEGLLVGYKWYDAKKIEPLFPFGYGLSYTDFAYNKVSVTKSTNGTKPIKVSFLVTNAGPVRGTETSQVYLSLPGSTGEPVRLAGYAQTNPKVGKSQKVTVTIDPKSADLPLSYYEPASHSWTIAPGTYKVGVGSSVDDIELTGKFTVQ
ncbi:beta-glucosidase [Luteimicrobium sp. DT211]|uniref:beta-glucosidase n=1 Tax=Luteimicrobium sp. DT211 TaxID=3393412 RepID=UPI003CF39670